jgi:phage shock protein B
MEDVFLVFMIPMIIFLIIVAPIWLILHYKSKSAAARTLNAEEQYTLEQLARVAEKMESRMAALERILDQEDPRWKEKT